MTGPRIYGHHNILAVMWLQFGHLATCAHLWWLQHPTVICDFSKSFPTHKAKGGAGRRLQVEVIWHYAEQPCGIHLMVTAETTIVSQHSAWCFTLQPCILAAELPVPVTVLNKDYLYCIWMFPSSISVFLVKVNRFTRSHLLYIVVQSGFFLLLWSQTENK